METTKEKSTNWGGARKGAGRKKTVHGKYYGFNSTLEVQNILESIDTSKSDFINRAITAYAKTLGM